MCMVRDALVQTEWQPTEERNILANYTSDRGLMYKICKGLEKKTRHQENNPILKWNTDLNK